MREESLSSKSRNERLAFEIYIRTGRRVVFSDDDSLEVKFNPWHDPETGRFTFKGQGNYFAPSEDRRTGGSTKAQGKRISPSNSKTAKIDKTKKFDQIKLDKSNYLPYLSEDHNKIISIAKNFPAEGGTRKWTTEELSKWLSDGVSDRYIFDFKRQWVRGYRAAIREASDQFDIPQELLAGVAFIEVGGDPLELDSIAYSLRGPKKRDKTSFGDMSIQFRRGVETLGYDASREITESQRRMVVSSLKNPQIGIFVAAKHLSYLRDIDFSGVSAPEMTKDQIEIVGSRYNRGPDISINDLKKNLSYGKAITKRWKELKNLIR